MSRIGLKKFKCKSQSGSEDDEEREEGWDHRIMGGKMYRNESGEGIEVIKEKDLKWKETRYDRVRVRGWIEQEKESR